MSNKLPYIEILLKKASTNNASPEELDELLRWIESNEGYENADWVASVLGMDETDINISGHNYFDTDDSIITDILKRSALPEERKISAPGQSRKLKSVFFSAAAIAFLLIALTIGIIIQKKHSAMQSSIAANTAIAGSATLSVPPGTSKAILTLADGSLVSLDSTSKGVVADQGSSKIEKTGDGQIVYKKRTTTNRNPAVAFNKLDVPKGGQYFVTLPDGTKVWLNAASSLKYPVSFSDTSRQVYLEGEAYFEVAKHLNKNGNGRIPFVVNIVNHLSPDMSAKIEVLGTHFNVHAYPDEARIETTLLKGKVNFYASSHSIPTPLTPGFQTTDETATDRVVLNKVNVNEAVAWKNGFFDFNKMDLKTVLLQLSRWYNVTVAYKGTVPNKLFYGKMQRSLYLNEVLDALQMEGVKFQLQNGNQLIVMP